MTSPMGRKRGGRWADRPPNVGIDRRGEKTYFYYTFPDNRKARIGDSDDAPAAFAKALALNGHFAAERAHLDMQSLITPKPRRPPPSARNPTLAQLADQWRRHVLADKRLSDRTREETEYRLARILRSWPDLTVQEFDTRAISAFLDPLTNAAWVKYRKLLLDLFQLACHQGFIAHNPVAQTLIKRELEKVRQRHTLAGLQAVRAEAPDWLQRAIDLALYSLQRRDDVTSLLRSQVDAQRNTITILQRKSRNYRNPVHLEIVMAGELRDAVAACLRSPIACPYLIHARPLRMTRQARESKPHPFAVTPSHLTREFARVRDACGAYAHLSPEERPTFHEIRALGIWLYEKAGFSGDYIMALSGHSTQAMFERYRRDHQELEPRRVEAGLTNVM